ncbi:hypothetical protein CQ13_01000 [Bradyrhizobium retamae]|uniref:Uncharacterized protein n=1 Tax=Bradyrhizobium retamae TaxID=1300035 RepID=A0A0R3NJI8_9BRAD|nr:hypothetical protein CQ13_01000 [Bradyrhizobium retamae]
MRGHRICDPLQEGRALISGDMPSIAPSSVRQPQHRRPGGLDPRHRPFRLPAGGLGAGSGVLLDTNGEIGRVSISVILVPFPRRAKAEPTEGPAPASTSCCKLANLPIYPLHGGELGVG